MKLADTLALGASASRREGSSPFIPTILSCGLYNYFAAMSSKYESPNTLSHFMPGFGEYRDPNGARNGYVWIRDVDNKPNISEYGTIDAFLKRPPLPEVTDSWNRVLKDAAEWGPHLALASEFMRSVEQKRYESDQEKYRKDQHEYVKTELQREDFYTWISNFVRAPDARVVDMKVRNCKSILHNLVTFGKGYDVEEVNQFEGWTIGYRQEVAVGRYSSIRKSVRGRTGWYETSIVNRIVLTPAGDIYSVSYMGYENDPTILKMTNESITVVQNGGDNEASNEQGAADKQRIEAYIRKGAKRENYIVAGVRKAEDIRNDKNIDPDIAISPREVSTGLLHFERANGFGYVPEK